MSNSCHVVNVLCLRSQVGDCVPPPLISELLSVCSCTFVFITVVVSANSGRVWSMVITQSAFCFLHCFSAFHRSRAMACCFKNIWIQILSESGQASNPSHAPVALLGMVVVSVGICDCISCLCVTDHATCQKQL